MPSTISAARIAGMIAAAILALLLIVTFVLVAGPREVVVPTNGVTAGGPVDNPGGIAEQGALRDRATLQSWPGETTRTVLPSREIVQTTFETTRPGRQLVQEWQANSRANNDILQDSRYVSGIATIPGDERGVLVQPQGRTWRSVRNNEIAYGGAIYIFGLSLLIALFLAWRGRIRTAEGESGESIERFSIFERANHWMTATSFLLMALTGVVILYGNALIRPWLGAGAYSELAEFSAWSHLTLAVPFVLGVLAMAVLWMRQNVPSRLDWNWLKHGGGFLRRDGEHPPARRFNAGQKLVYWGVVLGGLGLLVTGLFLMFPFYWAAYTGMQIAQIVHAALGLLLIGLIIGHIYIGTVGMQGAFEAMWSGRVDRNWAKEHHSLWYDEIASGKGPQLERTTDRPVAGAIGSLAIGGAIAIVLALLMSVAYREVSVGSAMETARGNPSVHLEPADLRTSALGEPQNR